MLRRAFSTLLSTTSPSTTLPRLSSAVMDPGSFETLLLLTDPSSISFPAGIESDSPPTITDSETERVIKLAAANIRNGDLVAFPTETVYGLGANALSGKAVERIYAAKGRPSDNPLILHISSLPMLRSLLRPHPSASAAPQLSPLYTSLIAQHWPGPLTLLFPTNPDLIPTQTTANLPTVAIRLPSHPVARALIHYAGVPLAAPSANSSGRPSPTRGEHVMRDLGGREGVSAVLEGGGCEVGLESTVAVEEDGIDGGRGDLKVLRPGGVTVEQLREVVARVDAEVKGGPRQVLVYSKDFKDAKMEKAPTTPGMKYKHYTPSIPVYLLSPTPVASGSRSSGGNATPPTDALPTPPSSTAPSPTQSPAAPQPSPHGQLPTPLEAIFNLAPPSNDASSSSKPIGLMLYTSSPLSRLLPSPSPATTTTGTTATASTTTTNPTSPTCSDSAPSSALPSSAHGLHFIHHPLGSVLNPSEAANRLFDGLLRLEREGCAAIFIEEGDEAGVGRAVGERVGKATGGEKGRIVVRV